MAANAKICDVAVVGAGSAGAAAALLCARRGLRVALLEAGDLDAAGARWINAVPAWAFDRTGIGRPSGDELLGEGCDVHLVTGSRRVLVRRGGLLEVDMRRLVSRLQAAAADAGATLHEHARAARWDGERLHTSAGAFAARWAVDASGLHGARLLGQPRPGPDDLCSAAQQVYAVSDVEGARRYFDNHGARLGDAVSMIGVAGGYSTIGLRCDHQGERVGLLTGSIPASAGGRRPDGPALLRRFVSGQPWIGQRLFGGSGAIRLGRPHDCLARERVALIGDAAGQVFSVHGSGVAQGLIAAALLADRLAQGRGVQGYAVAYQRRFGSVLAAFDLLRRFSQTLTVTEQEELVDAGMLSAHAVRMALSQADTLLPVDAVARAVAGAVTHPRLGARATPVITRIGLVLALYRAYPGDARRLPGWIRQLRRLVDR